jgi:hypothetical protein
VRTFSRSRAVSRTSIGPSFSSFSAFWSLISTVTFTFEVPPSPPSLPWLPVESTSLMAPGVVLPSASSTVTLPSFLTRLWCLASRSMTTLRTVEVVSYTASVATGTPVRSFGSSTRCGVRQKITRPSSTVPVRASPWSFCHRLTAAAVAEVKLSSTVKPV